MYNVYMLTISPDGELNYNQSNDEFDKLKQELLSYCKKLSSYKSNNDTIDSPINVISMFQLFRVNMASVRDIIEELDEGDLCNTTQKCAFLGHKRFQLSLDFHIDDCYGKIYIKIVKE